MKRSPSLERANPLEILALEPESNLWVRRSFGTLPFRPLQLFGSTRGGSELVESGIREHGRLVYVGFYEGVSGEDGGSGEGRGGAGVGHFVGLGLVTLLLMLVEGDEC